MKTLIGEGCRRGDVMREALDEEVKDDDEVRATSQQFSQTF